MNFKNTIKKIFRIRDETNTTNNKGQYLTLQQLLDRFENNLGNEPTYLNCLKYRSETLGKTPFVLTTNTDNGEEIINNDLSYLINVRPNKNEDATTFWQNVEQQRLDYGTAYVFIERDKKTNNVTALKRLDSGLMTLPIVNDPYELDKELVYEYQSVEGTVKMTSEDLLIFKNTFLSTTQITGISSIEILKPIIHANILGNTAIENINKNGIHSTVKVAIDESVGDDDAVDDIVNKALEQAEGCNARGVVFQEPGVTIEPFNVKLNDADYLNIYKNNQCIMLSYFGIAASQLNIEQTSGTYKNSESDMLHYLTNTMLYVYEVYVKELNYKLLGKDLYLNSGQTFKADTSNLLQVDFETLVNTYVNMTNSSIISLDEARRKLGFMKLPNHLGSQPIVNGAYVGLDQLGIAYRIGSRKRGGD